MELILQQMPIVVHSLNIGFLQTLRLFLVTLIGAFPLGLIIAFGSMSQFKPLSYFTKVIVWIVRGTPLMIQLLIIYYFPGLVLGKTIWGGGETGRFMAAAVSFIFNYACYFSEIFRGGIESIPTGQYEACKVLGMTKTETFFRVILLQVIKNVVPPISNEVITLVKDTSLARIITYYEIIFVAESYIRGSGILWPLLYSGVFYLVASGLLTILFNKIEKRLNFYKV